MAGKVRVLIVEDDPEVAADIRINLQWLKYDVVGTTESGHEAIKLAESLRPDLVLMDIVLPGDIDGIQAAESIGKQTSIPVIYMTAYSDAEMLERAKITEPFGYILKPVTQRDLQVTLAIALYRAHAESGLKERARLAATVFSLSEPLISVDRQGRVNLVNDSAVTLLALERTELMGQDILEILDLRDLVTGHRLTEEVCYALETQGRYTNERDIGLKGMDNTLVAVHLSASRILDARGQSLGSALLFHDVTERRLLSERLAHQASHDALTGLVNRQTFELRLQRILDTSRSGNTEHALCYLDLDQFKVINDTCGHVAGDELLRELGAVLGDQVRERDTLARLGGDEFGVLMEHCSLTKAERVAEALREAIAGFRFVWEHKAFSIGASIGLVPINETSESITHVLSAADTACYAAKDKGRNRIHVYREGDAELARRHGEMQWVARINRALEEDRFQLNFQPIVPVNPDSRRRPDGEGTHYELLLRMQSEDGRIVQPGAFVPAAERYNLIVKIDRWVIDRALKWLARDPEQIARMHLCCINVSGQSLGDEELLAFIIRQFEKRNIPPNKICFEVTETAAIAKFASASRFMEALRGIGCRFALDDFGSGLSSFAYLKSLPVDFLKIDGVFVKDIIHDPVDSALVKSINEIGHVMGKQTIAEFVNDEAILEKLQDIGVDYAQGYAVGAPQPIGNLAQVRVAS